MRTSQGDELVFTTFGIHRAVDYYVIQSAVLNPRSLIPPPAAFLMFQNLLVVNPSPHRLSRALLCMAGISRPEPDMAAGEL